MNCRVAGCRRVTFLPRTGVFLVRGRPVRRVTAVGVVVKVSTGPRFVLFGGASPFSARVSRLAMADAAVHSGRWVRLPAMCRLAPARGRRRWGRERCERSSLLC